jgi:hypothetical protein
MQRLYEIGFQRAGRWLLKGDELALELLHLSDRQNVLYAFISGNTVKYVGKTTQSLQRRMFGYQKPNKDQRTNWRNRLAIVELLKADHKVEILALADIGLLRYGAFHLNLAGGLEDSIINILKPEWNGGRSSTVIEDPLEANPPDTSTEAKLEKQIVEAVQHPARPHLIEPDPVVTINAITPVLAPPATGDTMTDDTNAMAAAPHFILTLQQTYHRTGFFNVPVSVDRYFGKDNTPITIYCGKEKLAVTGTINRTANTNGTPRIMGAVPLREWFQKRSTMKQLKVSIPEPNTIYILDN